MERELTPVEARSGVVSGRVLTVLALSTVGAVVGLALAWLFLFAGVVQLIYAFQQRAHDGFLWKLLSGLATLVLGIFIIAFPIASIASLALLIGAFLLVSGVSTALLAFELRPKAGWGWVLFDGIFSILIAILIASGWPQNSIDFVGILVGFCLISGGVWRIILGRALRMAHPVR